MTDLPKLKIAAAPACSHRLMLVPAGKSLPADLPELAFWQRVLKRKAMKADELAKSPVVADLPDGTRCALTAIDPEPSRFERLTTLRKAVTPLLEETPKSLAILPFGVDDDALGDALYVALVNGVPLPQQKKKPAETLKEIVTTRRPASADYFVELARANLLARELIALPPNQLDPAHYRARLRTLAQENKLAIEEFDFRKLKKMGAGAFCAVAQGSDANGNGAAIVRLSWRPKRSAKAPAKTLALVGKGICFDTGGHNLKPGTFMTGMHTDMGGSAVALGLLLAIARLRLPVAVDCWLAIAQNHVSPAACVPGDIVTALDGTTIEIVHTDAEGRMVLADALCLAARRQPDLIIDFATLTGSMKTALGRRYSGLFASDAALATQAVAAGHASGERVCAFPLDADYEVALESKVADIKQCTLEGGADHILAARFLKRFTADRPWLHMDLSATNCSGGLGAIATDITGFGVGWGITLLAAL